MSALVVYRKEILDTLRDRRTLAAMILVPMVVYPATLIITTETVVAEERAARDHVLEIGAAPALPAGMAAFLRSEPQLHLTDLSTSAMSPEQARRSLHEGLHAVLVMSATSAAALAEDGTARMDIYVDATEPSGDAPGRRLQSSLRRYADQVRDDRLQGRGLPPSLANPMKIEVRSVATERERGNHLLGQILPSLVLLFVAMSSLYPAIDLTAGEKERKTLATLLTTPVPLSDLVLGKLLAVVTVGTLAGLLNVAALGLTFLRVMGEADATTALAFDLGPSTVIGLLGAVLAAAFPVGATMLLFASFARSFRDANLLLTPVLLLAMLPAGVVLLPGAQLDSAFCLIPIANAALWMKALLTEEVAAGRVLLVLLSSGAMTAVLAAGVVRVFSDERALFSTEGRRADFARLLLDPPKPGLAPVLAFAAVSFSVAFFAGLLPKSHPLVLVTVTQVLGHLAPALGLAWWMRSRLPSRSLLGARAPSARGWAAGALLGLTGWLGLSLPLGWLTEWLIPGQAEAARLLMDTLGMADSPFWALVLAAALLPAVAEELAFRGVQFRLLGGGRLAILGQALLFGLMHASVYRFLPTFALGLALGVLRQRSGSVWPGVIAHALTNGLALTLMRFGPPEVTQTLEHPTAWALVGLTGVIAALLLARAPPADDSVAVRE